MQRTVDERSPAFRYKIGDETRSKFTQTATRTNGLERLFALLAHLVVEVPAASERLHGRLNTMRLAANDADFDRAGLALRPGARDTTAVELLVCRCRQLVLLGQINPELETVGSIVSFSENWHLCVTV